MRSLMNAVQPEIQRKQPVKSSVLATNLEILNIVHRAPSFINHNTSMHRDVE